MDGQLSLFEYIELEPKDDKNLLINYFELKTFENKTIESCYGDLIAICNALADYADIINRFAEENNLQGYHRALYEYQADRLRKVGLKIAGQLNYDREKAIEKCRKKQARKENDIGADAISLLVREKEE